MQVCKNGKGGVCVCVFSYCNDILTPLLFCSDTRVNWSTAGERSFKLWKHRGSIRQSLSAEPAVNRHCSSKCLVHGETVVARLSSPPNLLFLYVWLKLVFKEIKFVLRSDNVFKLRLISVGSQHACFPPELWFWRNWTEKKILLPLKKG